MFQKENKIIAAIMLASFIISLTYSFYFKIEPAVDAAAYDKIAWNLVQGNGYKESADLSFDEDIAILRVGPGYQFFLAAIYFIFGHYIWIIWIINAFLHALTAFLVYLLSREILKENWNNLIGFASAAFIGFSPDLITMSGMLMTETLAVFLITLAVYVFFKYINDSLYQFYLIILFAFILGLAVLIRTTVFLTVLPVFYYFFSKKYWKDLAVFIFVLAAVFTPWTVRNYKTYGVFIPTTNVLGYDLLVGNHPGATGELEPYAPAENYLNEKGSILGSRLALKDALVFIASHPLEFLKITFYRISIYFSFIRPTGFWFHLEGMSKALTLVFSAVYSILLFVLGFFGIYRIKELPPADKKRAKFLFWLLLTMPLAVIWIIVETRYRFLAYPFFAVFSGYGLAGLFNKKNNFKPALLIFSVLFLNAAFDAWRNSERIIERIKELL